MTAREAVGAQGEDRADRPLWEFVADPGRVRANQVQLQLFELVVCDTHVGELAKAGVDAINSSIAARGNGGDA